MTSEKKTTNAMGGKMARACESCLNKRDRWYCAADDAFLCPASDASVHSANQLASRHERVRLETASFKPFGTIEPVTPTLWHKGFTRKARTPQHNKAAVLAQRANLVEYQNLVVPLVPEIGSEDQLGFLHDQENEEHLLHRVPVFDPFDVDFCTTVSNEESNNVEIKGLDQTCDNHEVVGDDDDDLGAGFLPSEVDLAEFVADVESLLDRPEHDEDRMESGLLFGYCNKKEDEIDIAANYFGGETVMKVKTEDRMDKLAANNGYDHHVDPSLSLFRSETLDRNYFDHSDHDHEEVLMLEKDDEVMKKAVAMINSTEYKDQETKRKRILRLNYGEVITAWDGQSSPWLTGRRPDFNPDQNYWPDCLGTWEGYDVHNQYGSGNTFQRNGEINSDVGREARVSRYREKKRTRLFSKKIRYEVRKLNADKRPRMKGRFVKRTAFMGTTTTHINAFPNYPTK